MSGFLQSSNGNVNLQESNAFKHNNNNSNNSSKKVMEMENYVISTVLVFAINQLISRFYFQNIEKFFKPHSFNSVSVNLRPYLNQISSVRYRIII